jgi:hypothetical protein
MADGFHVDLDALRQAVEGINRTLDQMTDHRVSTIDTTKSSFGHDHLGDTVADFCDRWERGVAYLFKDGQGIAACLTDNVNTYAHADRGAFELFQQVLRGSPDLPKG